jgi:hypothetical protein
MLPIIAAGIILSSVPASPNLVYFDLNRDGKADSIHMEYQRFATNYTLFINGASYAGYGEGLHGILSIVDIDSTDGTYEIAVPESGPSDDPAVHLFYYNGVSICDMGKIPGYEEGMFDGSGRITTGERGAVLQTWSYPCIYRLDADHIPQRVRQELYPMGSQLTMKMDLPLVASRTDTTIITILRAGTQVVIEASDDSCWCLARAGFGVWGWFKLNHGYFVLPGLIPANEIFDGLCNAD